MHIYIERPRPPWHTVFLTVSTEHVRPPVSAVGPHGKPLFRASQVDGHSRSMIQSMAAVTSRTSIAESMLISPDAWVQGLVLPKPVMTGIRAAMSCTLRRNQCPHSKYITLSSLEYNFGRAR